MLGAGRGVDAVELTSRGRDDEIRVCGGVVVTPLLPYRTALVEWLPVGRINSK